MPTKKPNEETTDFGFEQVPTKEKAGKVAEVFHSVAANYDLMNDAMSLGLHRIWKRLAIDLCALKPGQLVLDMAGGTADLSAQISPLVGEQGLVVLADINESMLQFGRAKLLDRGIFSNIALIQADAEKVPFIDNYFDCVIIGFGLRNVTNKEAALQSFFRVLKPGGKLIILEFSKTSVPIFRKFYDIYSFKILPWLGKHIAKDEKSYRYLAESIRKHPDQEKLLAMMQTSGFENCDYHNFCGGIVAAHRGYKY